MEQKKDELNNVKYTKENLKLDVLEDFSFEDEGINDGKKTQRDYKYQLKVMQFIFNIEAPEYNFKKDNIEEIKDAIETNIEGDECLYGYTFNLASNPHFEYSWNYLRKQIDRYIETLVKIHKFIDYILNDINTMRKYLCEFKDLHIVFNDFFSVEFLKDEPFVKSKILWENFNQITNVDDGYCISALLGDAILITYFHRYKNKENNFVPSVERILHA